MNNEQVVEHIDLVNQIASEYLKGKTEAQISKELEIPRARVTAYVAEWKNMAANSEAVRARAREALAGADLHYNNLINQAYDIIKIAEGADTAKDEASAKTAALKLILDIEKSRLDMLQKAGLLENRELAEKLMEAEERQDAITKVLKEVVGTCPVCKPKVMSRLAGFGKEPIVYES